MTAVRTLGHGGRTSTYATQHTTPDPESYLFTQWNQPFAPADRRNARQMLDSVTHAYHGPDTGMYHIRKTMLQSWRDVDEMTRHH